MKYTSKTLLYTAILSALSLGAAAQTSMDYLQAADKFFKEGDYYSASQYYEKYLTGAPGKKTSGYNPYVVQKVNKTATAATSPSSRRDVVYNLAESYRLINYFSKAEPYYREAATMGTAFPLAAYWHAKSQRAMGKLDSAAMEFRSFLTSYTAQDAITKDVQKELDNISFVQAQNGRKDLARYVVTKAGGAMNSTGATYAPFYLADGTLTFTSTRPEGDSASHPAGKNPYTNKVFSSNSSSTISSDVVKLNVPLAKDLEQGVAAFTPDGNRMFVTRWEMKDKKKVAALFSSTKSGDSWSAPVKLSSAINVDGSTTQQPFVTTDGKYLLFASDRSGGQGGLDIWYTALSSIFEPSGDVQNLGSTINTAGDEEAPFYHQPSGTLVLASNGRTGMGGFDLYYSKGNFSTWEVPVNMGKPINSVKDDIYYASADKTSIWNGALFSSDRESPCCLEMFTFDRKSLPKVVSGTVVDCGSQQPLANAEVTITDANGNNIATKRTDASGAYTLTMAEYQALKVNGSASGYNSNAINVATPTVDADSMTASVLCLTLVPKDPTDVPPVTGDVIVFDNALFGFDQSHLTEVSKSLLDKVADRMKQYPNMTLKIESHTDNFGSDEYNMELSNKRAQACADYLVEKGVDSGRLTTEGFGEGKPVAPNTLNGKDNPAGRAKNRRTEFKVVKAN